MTFAILSTANADILATYPTQHAVLSAVASASARDEHVFDEVCVVAFDSDGMPTGGLEGEDLRHAVEAGASAASIAC